MCSFTASLLFGIIFISIGGFGYSGALTEEINLREDESSITTDTSNVSENMSVNSSFALQRDEIPSRAVTVLKNELKKKYPAGNRIVGGNLALAGEIPFQIAIQLKRGLFTFCGGFIISATWILTAEHCVRSSSFQKTTVQIRAGSLKTTSGGSIHTVVSVTRHPYPALSDAALIKVTPPFNFATNSIQPATLPAANEMIQPGTKLTVSGWGVTQSGGSLSPDLLKVEVPVVPQASCNTSYNGAITVGEICAGLSEGGKDSCQGDSGGPIFIGMKAVGIVSWGNGCALPGFPGVYASIAQIRTWIKTVSNT